MPIVVVCPEGHKLAAKEGMAGKYIKCPKCGSIVRIPKADAPQVDDERRL